MKTTHFILPACLCCVFLLPSTPSCAQKGKTAKQIVAASTQPALSAPVRASLEKSLALPVAKTVEAALPSRQLPALTAAQEAAQAAFLKEQSRHANEIATIMNFSLNKKILNYSFTLEQERANARRLVSTLQTYQTLNLNELQENNLLEKMSGFLVNKSLQNYLLDSMVNKNYLQFLRDLANYYSLSVKFMTSYELRFIAAQDTREIFAQTALDYMKAHPHKMNLKLREIMKSPFVTGELKASLRSFIALNQILPQHESSFLTVLREAHKQHSNGLAHARTEQDITAAIEIYRSSAKELEEFTKRYNRSPRWNAPLKERRLYNKLVLLIMHNQANHFKQVAPYIAHINQLLVRFPHVRMSANETMDRLQRFIQKNHRFPRSITEATEKIKVPEAELDLYESAFYWESKDKAFAAAAFELRKDLQNSANQ